MDTIGIIGGGEIGQAIEFLLHSKDLKVLVYDKNPEKNKSGLSLEEILEASGVLFVALPSQALVNVFDSLKGSTKESRTFVILSKGLIDGVPIPEILNEKGIKKFIVLGGPMIAEEILDGRKAFAAAASFSQESLDTVEKLFDGTNLEITKSSDPVGVSVLGVLKNIYSVLLGMVSELQYGENTHGFVLEESLKEMKSLCVLYGGKEESANGVSGLADLAATSGSCNSANRETGRKLARGEKSQGGEGIKSLSAVVSKVGADIANYPLLNALSEIAINNKDVKESLEKIIS